MALMPGCAQERTTPAAGAGASAPSGGATPAAAPTPPSGPPVDLPFAASGTEPGWALEIAPERLRLQAHYGETRLTAATPPLERDGAATIWRLDTGDHRLIVRVTPRPCTAASGRHHAHTVRLELDGETLTGCGGARIDGP